jgi:hypothetical protein
MHVRCQLPRAANGRLLRYREPSRLPTGINQTKSGAGLATRASDQRPQVTANPVLQVLRVDVFERDL